MIPFPGESVWISDAADATGTPDGTLYEDIVHRAGSRTLSSGQEWRALVYSGDMDYAEEAGLDATVQWAVEVVSGTATLSATEGLDPTYADYGATLGTSLGSHTVTGPATLLIDSTFTADQVADLDASVSAALQLGLTATAGSAVVQQIKLRVWPVGGALGAFVTQDAFDTTPTTAPVWLLNEDTHTGEALIPGVEDSWGAAAAALVADTWPTGPYEFTPATLSGGHRIGEAQFAGSQSNVDGTNLQTTLNAAPVVAMIEGADWSSGAHVGPGVTGYTRPPEEVREEAEAYLYPQTGTGSVGWVDAGLVIEQAGQAAAIVPAFTLATTTDDDPVVSSGGGTMTVDVDVIDAGAALSAPTAGGTLTSSHALPTDARYLFAHVSHTGVLDAAAWPGTSPGSPLDPAVTTGIDAVVHFGVGDPAGDFAPIKTYAHMPAYRVWMPDAVTATVAPLRLMQRSDGLGMGSGRVFGVGTRQASTRVFGSL